VSDFSAYVNGEVVVIDGGEWLRCRTFKSLLEAFQFIMGSARMMISKRINKIKECLVQKTSLFL
jgi:hypothetical protein